ncbi:MAG: uracil phosphoribosyltransferase [Crocinitomicaceae bacterium]
MVHEIGKTNSVLNHFINEIRNVEVQNDRMRFRKNMERISEILAYEMSKNLSYSPVSIQTPLGISNSVQVSDNIVIASILRAGLSMHEGVLNFFDKAENAFISAYREESDDNKEVKVIVEYLAAPSIENKTLVLVDPMLATGTSMILTLEALKAKGAIKNLHVISAIASQTAVDRLEKELPTGTHLWIAAVDPELNDKSYIVPGLGDAGDLAYGTK